MSEYQFREVEKKDILKLLSLFLKSYPNETKFSEEYLLWQYFDNPNGVVIGFNAWYCDEIVAHYSIIPTIFKKSDIYYKGCLSLNTATSPYHQQKGLFIKLARLTYEKAAKNNCDFVYGIANKNSIKGFIINLILNYLVKWEYILVILNIMIIITLFTNHIVQKILNGDYPNQV